MSGEVKDKLKSEATASKPRDEKGHFIDVPDVKTGKNPLEKFILSHTGNYKDQEDLLDIRIGNPLGRIISLLEQIKKQKAFSFTLKGSLGLAGVLLVVSFFGIFGGGQIICDKGIQSQIGRVKVLEYRELYSKPVPFLSQILELVAPPQKLIKKRTVLVRNDSTTIYLPFSEDIDISKFANLYVIATGSFNSCNQTLTLQDSTSLQEF